MLFEFVPCAGKYFGHMVQRRKTKYLNKTFVVSFDFVCFWDSSAFHSHVGSDGRHTAPTRPAYCG